MLRNTVEAGRAATVPRAGTEHPKKKQIGTVVPSQILWKGAHPGLMGWRGGQLQCCTSWTHRDAAPWGTRGSCPWRGTMCCWLLCVAENVDASWAGHCWRLPRGATRTWRPLPPPVSLQCPLVGKLSTGPAGRGRGVLGSSFITTELRGDMVTSIRNIELEDS